LAFGLDFLPDTGYKIKEAVSKQHPIRLQGTFGPDLRLAGRRGIARLRCGFEITSKFGIEVLKGAWGGFPKITSRRNDFSAVLYTGLPCWVTFF